MKQLLRVAITIGLIATFYLLIRPTIGYAQDNPAILPSVVISLDNNRDGTIDVVGSQDESSLARPYRFWLNNDHDAYSSDTYNDEDDHPWTVQSLDNSNADIESERDLEDLARLHITINSSTIRDFLTSGTMTAKLKWTPSATGNPAIRIFRAQESNGSTNYLSDPTAAASQISSARTAYGIVQGATTCDLPASFWWGISDTSPTKYLLFEGLGEGTGELSLELQQGSTTITTGYDVHNAFLQILDIRKMYERWKISATAVIPDPDRRDSLPITVSGVTSVADQSTFTFENAWDEDMQDRSYVVCVHGWQKSLMGARSDEITMFKRLWHRGFKGRYVGFYWPTYKGTGLTFAITGKFNHSEYRAWKCGDAFKTFVETQLPSGYRVNVVAHSLGNVMVASALNVGLRFDNYTLLNAAIPAQCFDPSPALRQTAATQVLPTGLGFPIVNAISYDAWAGGDLGDDTLVRLSSMAYRNRAAAVGSTTLTSFYLTNDYATTAPWEANQWSAGDWLPGVDSKRVDGYDYTINLNLWFKVDFLSPGRVVVDPHEAMAMANQSMTKAAGAEGRTHGAISSAVNLNGGGMVFGSEHTAEFMWRYHRTWDFYGRLMQEMDYPPTP